MTRRSFVRADSASAEPLDRPPVGRFGRNHGVAVLLLGTRCRALLQLQELGVVFEVRAARRIGRDVREQLADQVGARGRRQAGRHRGMCGGGQRRLADVIRMHSRC